MLILGKVDMFLNISPSDDIWTIKNMFPHDLHINFEYMHEKVCTIHTFKNSTPFS